MKKTKLTRSLMAACSIVALTAVMYGCVHDGGDDTTTGDMDMEMPMPDPTAGLFATATDSRTDAEQAGTDAADAVTAATEAAMGLSTMAVAGDSSMAMMNAEAIVGDEGAQATVGQAVTNAKTALADAEAAKTEAEALDDDNEHKASLIAALDKAIEVAKEQIMATEGHRDGDALKASVDAVTGGEDEDPQGTPRSIANAVGMDIAMALLPTATGGGIRVTHGDVAPADTIADELKVEMDDRVGMTWAEIIGDTTKMRIATSGTDTNEVDAASVDGMTLTSQATETADGEFADDGMLVGANYKGIAGTIFCVGSDCTVTENADDNTMRDLGGSWYFTPTNADEHWVENADGTAYVEDTLFTAYGHWLDVNGDGVWTVNTFADSDGATTYTLAAADDQNELGDDDTASYSGAAAGMSVYKTDNAAGDGQDINSGRFTANVSLTATFGASPMIGGTISGFGGSAVNENWRVTLEDATLAAGGTETGNAPTVATGRDGVWSNQAYGGDADARPTGVFGGFTAHFSDGHAAGAYATRKDD